MRYRQYCEANVGQLLLSCGIGNIVRPNEFPGLFLSVSALLCTVIYRSVLRPEVAIDIAHLFICAGNMIIPGLPPAASSWTLTSAAAAAISYADRGTSAIAASGILADLGWSESQLGTVQSSFFLGYGLTQVVGGLLSEAGEDDHQHVDQGGPPTSTSNKRPGREAFRTVLPLSIALTALATLAFPAAATYGGPALASLDRFLLGVFEGLLLPSAMAGVSQLVPSDKRATASSALIAGCYLGSALAYSSAAILFSSPLVDMLPTQSAWPNVFYVNGILSIICLALSRSEFDLPFRGGDSMSTTTLMSAASDLVSDTLVVGKATFSSRSGRAILAAQVGQGALLYSISSWGPLYLERVGASAAAASGTASGNEAAVTAAAATAAASLILPQLTQAAVGVGVGTASDGLAQKLGTVATRRTLQGLSGIVPALILIYLASNSAVDDLIASPVALFGVAQTISALSLGAVSVSHLEVAPRNAGTVYALGNVAAAVSGSVTVSLFGHILEANGGSDFGPPFLLVASLSAAGSLIYACTVGNEPEILVKRRKRSASPTEV